MNTVSAVLAGALAVAQSIAEPPASFRSEPRAGISFLRSEIEPIPRTHGLFTVPSLSSPGRLAIAVPEAGMVLFVVFDCERSTFRLATLGWIADSGGEMLVIAQLSRPRVPVTLPAHNSERTKAAEQVACGLGI